MNRFDALRYAALAVGSFQLLANVMILARGPWKIRAEHASGAVSERFADLLSLSWVYGGVANIFISILLILLAGPLKEGSLLAARVTACLGAYYVVVGLASYFLGLRRHRGLLVFVLLGLVLLVPLFLVRGQLGP
jgi:hypothetical protein